MKVTGKHVILSFVLLITGFMLAFSYQFTSERGRPVSENQWRHEDELRNKIILEQAVNRNLQEELSELQNELNEIEDMIASYDEDREERINSLMVQIENLRKMVGSVKVTGPGVEVTLKDSSYVPDSANPNDYIVHEHHVQMVVDELLIAGAEAIAINGYRISDQSYIQCVGPVIRIDGNTSFAPFVITAIGDAELLNDSLNLIGGVKDQIVSDYIDFRIQQKNEIVMEPLLSERG